MKFDNEIREEELKNKVGSLLFPQFDTTRILDNIDFCVSVQMQPNQLELFEQESLYWAEAKNGKGNSHPESLTQLVLTIGKYKVAEKYLPPAFVGAFDSQSISFVPYFGIIDILARSDVNWNTTPSDHHSMEFQHLLPIVTAAYDKEHYTFSFDVDEKELLGFVQKNMKAGSRDVNKINITRNNFIAIYHKWLKVVMPTIAINWNNAKMAGILYSDFYLADILSEHNATIKDKLFVLLRTDHYILNRRIDPNTELIRSDEAQFRDGQKAHSEFWRVYNRPPKKEFWDSMISRRDLLVPQDVRERKGSFFTPQQWVELSQDYLAMNLGEDWQDEWYIWDCCAGTGNMLVGLEDKYRIWASTLDKADVEVMRDRIQNGANLLEEHVFQFDFLNDDFSQLPESLRKIVMDPEKRKRLLIYINPPYAEAPNKKTVAKTGQNKTGVSVENRAHKDLSDIQGMNIAAREMYVQFLHRICSQIEGCKVGCFSKLKLLQSPGFEPFRKLFPMKLESLFICPAYTFDNVKGKFPIGFHIWDTSQKEEFSGIVSDVYDAKAKRIGTKSIHAYDSKRLITQWLISYRGQSSESIGFIACYGNDFQHSNYIYIVNEKSQLPDPRGSWINVDNLKQACIYYSVRHAVPVTWVNDRDQFCWPKDSWETDADFISNCLMFTVANLNISASRGVNHWLPFKEKDVNAPDLFRSHFLMEYISGTIGGDLFSQGVKLEFSKEAETLRVALADLYRYYYRKTSKYVDPSYYDIKEFFCGRKSNGKLKTESEDDEFTRLNDIIKKAEKMVRHKIEKGAYHHGFLYSDDVVLENQESNELNL